MIGAATAAPRERPLLANGPMVRAMLEGRKTQTRRPVDPQHCGGLSQAELDWRSGACCEDPQHCPYGVPGELLWVREAFNVAGVLWGKRPCMTFGAAPSAWRYAATDTTGWQHGWRPSIHMPRWACRLVLEITEVRVQQLSEVSEADAIAEGIERVGTGWKSYRDGDAEPFTFPQDSFLSLWDSIYGEGAWRKNPYVWAITFNVVRGHTQ